MSVPWNIPRLLEERWSRENLVEDNEGNYNEELQAMGYSESVRDGMTAKWNCYGWVHRHVPDALHVASRRLMNYLLVVYNIPPTSDADDFDSSGEDQEDVNINLVNSILRDLENRLKADFPQHAMLPIPFMSEPAPLIPGVGNEAPAEEEDDSGPMDDDDDEEEEDDDDEEASQPAAETTITLRDRVSRLMSMVITTQQWAKELLTDPPWTDHLRIGVLNATKKYMPGESTPADEIMVEIERALSLNLAVTTPPLTEGYRLPLLINQNYDIRATRTYTNATQAVVPVREMNLFIAKFRSLRAGGKSQMDAIASISNDMLADIRNRPWNYLPSGWDQLDPEEVANEWDANGLMDAELLETRARYSHGGIISLRSALQNKLTELGLWTPFVG